MKKIKVLYLVGGTADKYGASILANNIIRELNKNDALDLLVITAKKGTTNILCDELGIENYYSCYQETIYVPLSNRLLDSGKHFIKKKIIQKANIDSLRFIEKKINLHSVDIIHSNLNRDVIGGMIHERHGIPHVWHLQEMVNAHFNIKPIYDEQFSWMNKNGTRFIAISKTVAHDWSNSGLDKNKIDIVYNGINIHGYRQRGIQEKSNKMKIIMAGMIYKEKGQEDVIRALSLLPSLVKENIRLDLYGGIKTDYKNHLELLIKELNLTKNIVFKGYSTALAETLCEYDIGINCSKAEGFGLSTLEYMTAGLCVIASNSGANCELIENEFNGLLFQYGSNEQIAKAIEKLWDNQPLRDQLSKNAKSSAECFSIERCADGVYSTYLNVLKNDNSKNRF